MHIPVEQHYTRDHLLEDILAALQHSGVDTTRLTRKDLAAVDEFHVRGAAVTTELAQQAGLQKDMRVLDIGCGIGGPCRLLADEYGCMTTGIDITQEYIRTATALSELTGLSDRTQFIHASALQLPFAAHHFDRVWTQHVQMNVGDKKQFYAEISRVLKPGGQFLYYDILSIGHQPIRYPVPWAETAAINHLQTTNELRTYITESGLQPITTTDQTNNGILFLQHTLEKIAAQGAPPVSLQLLIGASIGEKLKNLYQNLVEKKLQLESGACNKPGA